MSRSQVLKGFAELRSMNFTLTMGSHGANSTEALNLSGWAEEVLRTEEIRETIKRQRAALRNGEGQN